jgi:hypothetical protein
MKNLIITIIFVILFLIIFIYFLTQKKKKKIVFSDVNEGCLYKRFGCCNDKLTTKLDQDGTNCRGF